MKFVRFDSPGVTARWGQLRGTTIDELTGNPLHGRLAAGISHDLDAVRLLAPTVRPSKVICFGKNYGAHAIEMGWEIPTEPVMFLKPPSAIIGPLEAIELPTSSQRVEPEAELAVIIGRAGKRISAAEALDHVFGFTIANDVSARDLMAEDGQWSRAKGFDSFLPMGPYLTTDVAYGDLEIITALNGTESQRGRTSQMLWKLPELIALCSRTFSLEVGDIILTGSPAGRTRLRDGHEVSITIDGLGTLINPVRDAPALASAS